MTYLQGVVKPRISDSHKGDYGKILIIGGSARYVGAPALAGLAALAAGADLVTIAAPEKAAWAINTYSPDLITVKLGEDKVGVEHVEELAKLAEKFDVVLIGNGLDNDKSTLEAIPLLFKKIKKPIVMEADCFKAKFIPRGVLMTPNRAEFERFYGALPKESEKAMKKILLIAKKTKNVILLKGPIDMISDGKRMEENHIHNPEMTVGGTGDVLAGIAATFLAWSGKKFESAAAAAIVNGVAGDICLKRKRRVTASGMIEFIPEAIQISL